MSVRFSRAAGRELRAQIKYLLEHSPAAAHQLKVDLDELLDALDARAFDGPEVQSDHALAGILRRRIFVDLL